MSAIIGGIDLNIEWCLGIEEEGGRVAAVAAPPKAIVRVHVAPVNKHRRKLKGISDDLGGWHIRIYRSIREFNLFAMWRNHDSPDSQEIQ